MLSSMNIWIYQDEWRFPQAGCAKSVPDHFYFLQSPLQVTGDTVYNMLRLAEVECDSEERPLNPHKIKSAEVF